jgi:hypothetical protein
MLTTPVDVCVVAVKSMQLEAVMGRVPADRLADALVVPLLSGVEHVGTLSAQYGCRVLPATMRVASTRVAPGVIEHTSPFMKVELALSDEEDDGLRRERVVDFAGHLQAAGVDVGIRGSELSMLWGSWPSSVHSPFSPRHMAPRRVMSEPGTVTNCLPLLKRSLISARWSAQRSVRTLQSSSSIPWPTSRVDTSSLEVRRPGPHRRAGRSETPGPATERRPTPLTVAGVMIGIVPPASGGMG